MFTSLAGERWVCASTLHNMLHARLRKVSSKSSSSFTLTLTGFTARKYLAWLHGGGEGTARARDARRDSRTVHAAPDELKRPGHAH